MLPQRLLLVDDDPLSLRRLTVQLEKQGYTYVIAGSAEVAIRLLRRQQYGLLITDMIMPGNEDLAFFKALPTLAPNLPMIIVSGSGESGCTGPSRVPGICIRRDKGRPG